MATGSYLSIITLNVNGLKAPTKRQRLVEWIKNKTTIYDVFKSLISNQGNIQTESEGQGKIFHAKGDQKKGGVAILMSDKIDFKTRTEKRQRWSLHNDQRINPRRRYNNYKYICTQHRITAICKEMLTEYERGN